MSFLQVDLGEAKRVEEATSKLIRGLLEVVILDSIAREPRHGYGLIQELEKTFGAPPNRNQVYPLLNRLEREGFLHADRAAGRGRTRYALTGKGLELLKAYRLRPPGFAERVLALWGPEASTVAPKMLVRAPAQPPLVDRLRWEPGTAEVAAPRPDGDHAPHCAAEFMLRKRPASGHLLLEMSAVDPACPGCSDLLASWRELRDRWL